MTRFPHLLLSRPRQASQLLLLMFAGLVAAVAGMATPPVTAQVIDRWLYQPYGQPPRLDRDRVDHLPAGYAEGRFSYEGRPNGNARFGRHLLQDWPPPPATGSEATSEPGMPSISEINRLMETFHQAAVEAELAAALASSPADWSPPAPETAPPSLPTASESSPLGPPPEWPPGVIASPGREPGTLAPASSSPPSPAPPAASAPPTGIDRPAGPPPFRPTDD